jgi:hypothetical protein
MMSLSALAGAYFTFILVIFLCRSYLPAPGVRDNGYDPARLKLLSQADNGTSLAQDWDLTKNGSYQNGQIVLSHLDAVLSPFSDEKGTKYVSFSCSEKVDPSSLTIKGCGQTYADVIEGKSAHYLDDKDGYRYEMLFYYDRPDLRAFSLEYNGTSPANIYISQLCFYALIQG